MGWFGSHFWEGPSSHVEQKMYQSFSPVLLRLVLVYAWSSSGAGDEEPNRPICQINLVIILHGLPEMFCHFIDVTAHNFANMVLNHPRLKELQGFR